MVSLNYTRYFTWVLKYIFSVLHLSNKNALCLHRMFTKMYKYFHQNAGVSTWLSMNRTSNNISFSKIYLFLTCFSQNPCVFRDLCKKLKHEKWLFLIRSLFLHMLLKEITKAIKDFLNENHQYFQMITPNPLVSLTGFDDST